MRTNFASLIFDLKHPKAGRIVGSSPEHEGEAAIKNLEGNPALSLADPVAFSVMMYACKFCFADFRLKTS